MAKYAPRIRTAFASFFSFNAKFCLDVKSNVNSTKKTKSIGSLKPDLEAGTTPFVRATAITIAIEPYKDPQNASTEAFRVAPTVGSITAIATTGMRTWPAQTSFSVSEIDSTIPIVAASPVLKAQPNCIRQDVKLNLGGGLGTKLSAMLRMFERAAATADE